jgi:hypothetical protein
VGAFSACTPEIAAMMEECRDKSARVAKTMPSDNKTDFGIDSAVHTREFDDHNLLARMNVSSLRLQFLSWLIITVARIKPQRGSQKVCVLS